MPNSIMYHIEKYEITLNNSDCLVIKGWAFSNNEKSQIEYKVVDENCNIEIDRYNRSDVQRKFPQNIGALKSGFSIKVYGIQHLKFLNLIIKCDKEIVYKIDIRKVKFSYTFKKIKDLFGKVSLPNIKKVLVSIKKYGLKYTICKIKSKLNQKKTGYGNTSTSVEHLRNQYIEDLFKNVSGKSDDYLEPSDQGIVLAQDDIKYIAFYLPQYHPIKENDLWWGKGFTEWTNVSKAVPQFTGHYQPHLPGELGFYDLRIIDVMKRQAELAKKYGIYGFCFYHYWFSGKRLLEKPVNQLLANPDIDIPFCLCWANENWTRTWDGFERDILIGQNHSPDDDINFIKDIVPAFRDKRYIRISGRPVLIVYRAKLLPNPKETANRWKEYCKNSGIGDIYLIAAQGFGLMNPDEVGFDAALEFPPHTIFDDCTDITESIPILNKEFKGFVLDYSSLIKKKNYLTNTSYKLFKTVSPAWDNTARKPNSSSVFYGSTPDLYFHWLNDVSLFTKKALKKEEQFVFINAWNEWAEGAHLEPDRKFGYAYLQSTADALLEYRKNKIYSKRIIYVAHDANFNGAQLLTLSIIKILSEKFKYSVHLILKQGGPLENEYSKYATIHNLNRNYGSSDEIHALISMLYNQGIEIAITNTVISGDLAGLLVKNNIKTISLIHELTETIKVYNAEDKAVTIAKYSDKVIFPSEFVRKGFEKIAHLNPEKVIICPQGLYKSNLYKEKIHEARVELRKQLDIKNDSDIIIGVGFADFRKGIDLFIQTAVKVNNKLDDTYFLWVGNRDEVLIEKTIKSLSIDLKKSKIIFIDNQKDVSLYYAGADLYLMTSREDPFPSVVLEAMEVGLPVVGFDDAGGFVDIINIENGDLVPYLDIDKMADSVKKILNNHQLRSKIRTESPRLVDTKFRFDDYIYKLLSYLGHDYKKVSVIVPNYNYEALIKERLNSILEQNYPVYELIVLDDCSKDHSVEVINKYKNEKFSGLKFHQNTQNSGSVFRQWSKGINLAKGEYVWIAEADDLSSIEFLDHVMSKFYEDNDVILSYCQSKQMAGDGSILAEDYLEYTIDIDKTKWLKDYIEVGTKEITDVLSVKNTIPNVSATVFKKVDIEPIIDELCSYKIAGDWYFYVWLIQKGKIAFTSKSLNYHRRHNNSVTRSEKKQIHFDEIVKMQNYIMKNHEIDVNIREKIFVYREKVKDIIFKD